MESKDLQLQDGVLDLHYEHKRLRDELEEKLHAKSEQLGATTEQFEAIVKDMENLRLENERLQEANREVEDLNAQIQGLRQENEELEAELEKAKEGQATVTAALHVVLNPSASAPRPSASGNRRATSGAAPNAGPSSSPLKRGRTYEEHDNNYLPVRALKRGRPDGTIEDSD